MVSQQREGALDEATRWNAMRDLMKRARRSDVEVRPDLTAPPFLSHGQEQMFGICQRFPGSSVAYNMSRVYRFKGVVHIEALASALHALVTRHESLRTGFLDTPEGARRMVTDDVPDLRVEDLTHLPAAERDDAARLAVEQDLQAEFDLGKPPLVRAKLLRLAADDYVFVLVIHHIVADGWSWGIIHRDISEAYAAFTEASDGPPPRQPVRPYSEFVALQRARLASSVGRESLDHWVRHLRDLPEPARVPIDKVASNEVDFSGDRHVFRLGEALSRQVREVSAGYRVTPAAVMLGSFARLLREEHGSRELVVAAPYANRLPHRMNDTVGYFVNSHVLRVPTPADATPADLIRQADSQLAQALLHQEVPFPLIEAELAGTGGDIHLPKAFRMMFFFHGQRKIDFSLPGVAVSRAPYFHNGTTKSDLTLIVHEDDEEIVCHFEYSTVLYTSDAMERAAQAYLRVLEDLPAIPGRKQ
ncbi:condensation domain-containing protein [Streptomyces filamentosus]|uniref:Condensation domain-containing protein n=2 Tax=Streptomyces filamentosus TaxID=67294 RepID=A0ABY4V095_STRFL|nr:MULTISPECIES: condensation domain-containing protein [Streptomyces]ESU51209.1 Long-chain-fatty-acid--CoA ligase [Streptomyces sp. HCCB10043]MYR80435.1 thioester reductase [Streptomyces sp. SID5466]USC48044.1 condensation domain-containing protein [Streptomyces filamentosus]